MMRVGTMFLAAASAIAGAAGVARATVFDEMPSDAQAVFEIRNIDQLNTKLAKFADSTGLTQASPNFKNPLAYIEDQFGISKGINTGGDVALVFFQSGEAAPTNLALVSVSDYKAFVGNFTGAQEGADGITAAQGRDGTTVYITHWGDYAAVGETKDLVSHKPAGIKLDGLAADELKKDDSIVYFNPDQLRANALPELKKNRDKIIDRMSKRANTDAATSKLVWSLILDQAQEFLTDLHAGVIGVNVGDDGIAMGGAMDFLPNTKFSELAAAMKGSDAPKLGGLPDKHYLMLFGEMLSPELKQQIITNVIDPLSKGLDPSNAHDKAMSELLTNGKAKLTAVDGASVGVIVPAGAFGRESMIQAIAVVTGDAPAWKKAELANFDSVNSMAKAADPNAPVNVTIDLKSDAQTIDGTHLDQFTVKTDFNGTGQRAAQAERVLSMIFPNGQTGFIGAVTDKIGVATFGIDDQSPLLADAVAGAKTGKDVLSSAKLLQDVAGKLPPSRVAEGYVFIDQIVKSAARYAQGMGLGIQIHMPADVDPIGFAISGDGTTVRADEFIPASLVSAIAGAVNDLKNGGGGGGGGGNGPQPGGGQGL